jgi:F0F1-type ATP synthase membrane subunit a
MYALANAVKIAVVPLLVPVIFIFLELLFGTIQALVFAASLPFYITMAAVATGMTRLTMTTRTGHWTTFTDRITCRRHGVQAAAGD